MEQENNTVDYEDCHIHHFGLQAATNFTATFIALVCYQQNYLQTHYFK